MDAAVNWTWQELARNGHRPETGPSAEEEQARVEAEVEAAFQRGLQEGMARGRAQARRELSGSLAVANQVVDDVQAAQAGWLAGLEETLAGLAVGIARQLVERELEADPTIVAELVRRAMTHFPTGQTVRIRLHPGDLKALSEADEGPPADVDGREARWIADPSVPAGSFLLEGPERVLDGRLDRALERIFRSLTDA